MHPRVSLHCCLQLPLVKFEILAHSIFRNKNSTLEINVSHFGVLHWQQWKPPASAPGITSRPVFMIVFVIWYSFSLSYLFDWMLEDLMFSCFLQGKMCTPRKSSPSQTFYAPEGIRSAWGTQFVQAWIE